MAGAIGEAEGVLVGVAGFVGGGRQEGEVEGEVRSVCSEPIE